MGCKQSRQFADQPPPYALVVAPTTLAPGPLEASKATAAPKRGGAPNHVDDEFARFKRTRQLVRAADKLDIADAHQEAAIRRIASYLAPEMGIADTTLPAPVIMSLAREGCRWGCDFRVELSGDGNYDVMPVGERGDSTDV